MKLQRWRDGQGTGTYDKIFADAQEMLGVIQIDELPGARRQPRTGSTTPFDHYRQRIYLPFIDSMMSELENRFSAQSALAIKLSMLLPKFMISHSTEFSDVLPTAELYDGILPCPISSLESQFETWYNQWENVPIEHLPNTITESLDQCNKTFLPGIYALLQIFATIPVSTAAAERSFSALKLLKTYLRSTMNEDRISSLALVYIHNDLKIDVEKIIDRFAIKNRRLKFN